MATSPETKAAMVAAATLVAEEFVLNHFFAMAPFAYRGAAGTAYDEFQAEIAALLAVPADNVCLIGSARTGFSLNRDHLLKGFGYQSDLDLVVVSSDAFDRCWDELIKNTQAFKLAGDEEWRRLKKTRDNFFNGYLRADQLPSGCTLSREWFPLLAGPFRCPVARRYPVKAWLFKSWTHATECYKGHMALIQADIQKLLALRGEI
jgi:hypothetical protein